MNERRIGEVFEVLRRAHGVDAAIPAPDAAWRAGVMRVVRQKAAGGARGLDQLHLERVFWRFAAAGSLAAAMLVVYSLVSGDTAGAAGISLDDPLGLVGTLTQIF